MVDALEQMLRPGEWVVWRTPRRWWGADWISQLWALFWVGLVTGLLLGCFGWSLTAIGLALLPVLAVFGVAFAQINLSAATAVTDQRVLWVDTSRETLGFTSVELSDVAAVEVFRDCVEVTRQNCEVVTFEHPGWAPSIGESLSRAVGLPTDGIPRRETWIARQILFLLIWFGMGLVGSFTMFTLKDEAVFANGLADMALRILLTAGAMAAWWLLIGLLGLVVIKRFLTLGETKRLVLRSNLFLDDKQNERKQDSLLRFALYLALRFVDFLYRRPAAASSEGHGHGG